MEPVGEMDEPLLRLLLLREEDDETMEKFEGDGDGEGGCEVRGGREILFAVVVVVVVDDDVGVSLFFPAYILAAFFVLP